jgi:ribosomal protein L20
MPRVKRSTKRSDRRKKILKRASGYFLTKSKLYQAAQEAVERSLMFAYTGRKQKKRQFRSLWIVRIGAAAKLNGMSYSTFIAGSSPISPPTTQPASPRSPSRPRPPSPPRSPPRRQRNRSFDASKEARREPCFFFVATKTVTSLVTTLFCSQRLNTGESIL